MTMRVEDQGFLPRKRFMKLGGMALMAGTLALWGATATPADEVAKTFSISGRARVHVETDDAAVRVSTGDIKQVEVRVEYSGYKLDKDLRVNTSQNGDAVEVSVKTGSVWNWGMHHTSVRVEIHMPKDADLRARSGDGSVEADSINGNVDITTGDGSITVQGAKGNIRFHTGDGHIEARGLDGRVDASSGDGHVSLEGSLDGLNIKTGDASVDVEIPGDLQADIDASTHDGHISLGLPVTVQGNFSSSQIHGKMNGGGQLLTIRTGDGSIHLSKS